MRLADLVININNYLDQDLVIFQKNEQSIEAEIYLFDRGEDNLVITKENVKYKYLLEVDLAKEIIDDYINSLQIKPTPQDIAQRLFQYAIYDA